MNSFQEIAIEQDYRKSLYRITRFQLKNLCSGSHIESLTIQRHLHCDIMHPGICKYIQSHVKHSHLGRQDNVIGFCLFSLISLAMFAILSDRR